jgi:hypothetical protein
MNVIGRLIKGVFFSAFLLAFLSIALVVSYKYSQDNRSFLSMSDAQLSQITEVAQALCDADSYFCNDGRLSVQYKLFAPYFLSRIPAFAHLAHGGYIKYGKDAHTINLPSTLLGDKSMLTVVLAHELIHARFSHPITYTMSDANPIKCADHNNVRKLTVVKLEVIKATSDFAYLQDSDIYAYGNQIRACENTEDILPIS